MDQEKELQELKEKLEKELNNLKNLPNEDRLKKNEDIKSMIPYYLGLSDNIDKRRISTYQFTLQYLVVLLTAFGVFLKYIKPEIGLIFWTLTIVFIIQILSSIWLIFIYLRQTKFNYPFKGLNKWKWFYYGNKGIQKASTRIFPEEKRIENTKKPYFEGLIEFVSNYINENSDKELSDNIQQLYLLQAHNYYKNKFDAELTNIRINSLYLSFWILIVASFLYILCPYI